MDDVIKTDLPKLTRAIISSYDEFPATQYIGSSNLPNRDVIIVLIQTIREVLFPGFFGRQNLSSTDLPLHVHSILSSIRDTLFDQVRRAIRHQHQRNSKRDAIFAVSSLNVFPLRKKNLVSSIPSRLTANMASLLRRTVKNHRGQTRAHFFYRPPTIQSPIQVAIFRQAFIVKIERRWVAGCHAGRGVLHYPAWLEKAGKWVGLAAGFGRLGTGQVKAEMGWLCNLIIWQNLFNGHLQAN